MNIQDLVINNIYNNQDIVEVFKCAPQGGMRRAHETNTLVLIADNTGENVYRNKWIDGKLHYTGMGQKDDQDINDRQNKTLNESNHNGVDVYLFEVDNKGEYIFRGKVELDGLPYSEKEADIEGNQRIVYRFPLKIVGKN